MPARPPRGASASSCRCTSFPGRTPRSRRSCPRRSVRHLRRADRSRGPAWPCPRRPTDRDLASIAEARALARRAKAGLARSSPNSTRSEIDAIVDAMAAAAAAGRGVRPARRRRDRLRRRRRQDPEEPVRRAEGLRVHPADEDRRRDRAARGPPGHRNRRAVRRGRRDRAVHEPDLDRDLQDSDRHQGPMHRSCSARIPPRCSASPASRK